MKTTVLFLFILSLFVACSTNDVYNVEEVVREEHGKETNPNPNVLTFIYKGTKYSSSYILTEDSTKIFEDVAVSTLMDKFKQNSGLSILVIGEDSYIFDTENDKISFKDNNRQTKESMTYPAYANVLFQINKRHSGKGEAMHFLVQGGSSLTFPEMPSGWDEAISSCRMTGNIIFGTHFPTPTTAGMIFYEHSYYKGKSLEFSDLSSGVKDFSHRDYFSSFGFDRIASSMTLYAFRKI